MCVSDKMSSTNVFRNFLDLKLNFVYMLLATHVSDNVSFNLDETLDFAGKTKEEIKELRQVNFIVAV